MSGKVIRKDVQVRYVKKYLQKRNLTAQPSDKSKKPTLPRALAKFIKATWCGIAMSL